VHITDVALLKTRDAIAQIKVPHFDKAVIKTQSLHILKTIKETCSPIEKCSRIILADIL